MPGVMTKCRLPGKQTIHVVLTLQVVRLGVLIQSLGRLPHFPRSGMQGLWAKRSLGAQDALVLGCWGDPLEGG